MNYELTYEQCLRQGLGPLLFPKRLETEDPHRAQMKAVCVQNMQTQAKMLHVLTQAWQALEDAGIRAVLMKGLGLAQYYPAPEQRQWSDIDLYVGPDQYHPACAVMRATFPDALKFDEELEHYKHYNLITDGVSIEIHRVTMGMMHPRDIRLYRQIEAYGASHALELKIEDLRLKIFEVTFNALFVMLHSWEHKMHGNANLRQIADLSFLLQHEHDKIDKSRLQRWLKDLRLMEVWQLYMYAAVALFGLKPAEAPFYTSGCAERAERMVSDILAERRVESGESREKTNRWLRKWGTMRRGWKRAAQLAVYSPAYARHLKAAVLLKGLTRLFAPDRKWE